ncbi:MAG TPA: hypothetical protein VLX64_01110 [Thermoplasmata archaeon]|nr:hypothetical protein [Thermoplasmata archaeon]
MDGPVTTTRIGRGAAEGVVRAGAEAALARRVLAANLALRPRENLTVEAWSHALPWARALVVEAHRIGADPVLAVEDEDAFFDRLAAAPRRDVPTAPRALLAGADAYVYLGGPEAFPRLFGVAPGELRAIADWHSPAWRAEARRRRVRVARLAIADATPVAAGRFGVDVDAWRDELLAAMAVGPDRLARAADSVVRAIASARRLRIRHDNGTDLTVEVLPGSARGDIGRVSPRGPDVPVRLPAGRVTVRLRPGRGTGVWESNRPTYDRFAEPSTWLGARFVLGAGRLREFSFDRGGEAFALGYGRGGRGRELVTELCFGVNPAIDRAPEVGELAAGSVSLRIGGRGARFSFGARLHGAALEIDGRPWRAVVGRRPRRNE